MGWAAYNCVEPERSRKSSPIKARFLRLAFLGLIRCAYMAIKKVSRKWFACPLYVKAMPPELPDTLWYYKKKFKEYKSKIRRFKLENEKFFDKGILNKTFDKFDKNIPRTFNDKFKKAKKCDVCPATLEPTRAHIIKATHTKSKYKIMEKHPSNFFTLCYPHNKAFEYDRDQIKPTHIKRMKTLVNKKQKENLRVLKVSQESVKKVTRMIDELDKFNIAMRPYTKKWIKEVTSL
jgi:hypothetical protein